MSGCTSSLLIAVVRRRPRPRSEVLELEGCRTRRANYPQNRNRCNTVNPAGWEGAVLGDPVQVTQTCRRRLGARSARWLEGVTLKRRAYHRENTLGAANPNSADTLDMVRAPSAK